MPHRIVPAVVVWLLLGPVATATAQESAAARRAGPALEQDMPPLPRMLAGARLKACVKLDEETRELDTQISIKGPYLTAAERQYEVLGERLDEWKPRLDLTDADEVDRYNRTLVEHGDAVDAYNALLPEFNALVAQQNDGVERFNRDCAERPYYRKQWLEASSVLRRERMAERERAAAGSNP
jgi:hypothetical protein